MGYPPFQGQMYPGMPNNYQQRRPPPSQGGSSSGGPSSSATTKSGDDGDDAPHHTRGGRYSIPANLLLLRLYKDLVSLSKQPCDFNII